MHRSRSEAKAAGASQYCTGHICKNGHMTYRYAQSGTCAGCIAESAGRLPVQIRAGESIASREAREERFRELVTFAFLVRPQDAEAMRESVVMTSLLRYPSADRREFLAVDKLDNAASVLRVNVRIHPADVDVLKQVMSALNAQGRPDRATLMAKIEEVAAQSSPSIPLPSWLDRP